jgi:hypothetical protein
MSFLHVLVVCFLLFLAVLWLRALPAFWRNEHQSAWDPERPPKNWPYGMALWHGFVRLTPLSGFVILTVVVSFVGISVGTRAGDVVGLVFGVLMCALLAVAGSVVFFNEPKAVVAPHLRHQPGAFAEWRGAPVERSAPPHR